jgi:uncharacterized protein YcbK (DUF882 family)
MMTFRNFSPEEMACHDDTPYPEEWYESRLWPLFSTAQTLRDAVGRPVSIISGYRSPAWNAKVGGVDHSQHPQGRAMDIRVAAMTPKQVHAKLLELYAGGKLPNLGGLGLYLTFVHLDVRPRKADGSLARWNGAGVD